MFDSNAMQELAHLSRDRYQRAGGGGAHKVYASSKAYYDARGHNEQSAWDRLLVETKFRWRYSADTAAEHFRIACLTSHLRKVFIMAIPFHFEEGADGKPQAVLPGAERVTEAAIAQARANAALKPKKPQRPCDVGLFSDQSQQKEFEL